MSENSDLEAHTAWLQKVCLKHPKLCGTEMMEASCGYLFPPGWRDTTETLLERIEAISDGPQEVQQIKEKIGVLHINLLTRTSVLIGLITDARNALSSVCGGCGASAPPKQFDTPTCSTCRLNEAST